MSDTITRSTNYPLGNNFLFQDISEILQRGPWTFGKSTRGPDFADFDSDPSGFPKLTRGPQFFQFGLKFGKYLQKGP
jgi:hypothetical protein